MTREDTFTDAPPARPFRVTWVQGKSGAWHLLDRSRRIRVADERWPDGQPADGAAQRFMTHHSELVPVQCRTGSVGFYDYDGWPKYEHAPLGLTPEETLGGRNRACALCAAILLPPTA
jgi:hypothetical protein